MKLLEKNRIESLSKTFRYTFKDRRKLFSLIIVSALPLVLFSWRFVPDGIDFSFYDELSLFVWTFSIHFALVMISAAWFFSTPRRDFATQIIVLASLFLGVFLTWNTLPLYSESPWWVDVLVSLVLFSVVSVYLYYVYRNYINRSIDYKQLHDGIVHDLHHQKFLNSISRIEGLMKVADIEEPYKSMCEDEIADLKESVAYVADKYKALY